MGADFTCFAEVRRNGQWRLLNKVLKEQRCRHKPEEFDFGGIQRSCEEMATIFGGPSDSLSVAKHGEEIGALPEDCSAELLQYAEDDYTSYPGTLTLGELKEHQKHLDTELSDHIKRALAGSIARLFPLGSDEDVRIVYWFS